MSVFTDQLYANAASSAHGLVVGGDVPVRRTWAEVHHHARRVAGSLADAGVGPSSTVAILAAEPGDVAPVAQAVWMRGAALTMLQQPTPRTDLAGWLASTSRAARMIDASMVVVGAPFDLALTPLAEAGHVVATTAELSAGRAVEPLHPNESDVAMYQLTSGSTGTPKAVQITHANLLASSIGLAAAVDLDPETDVLVTWLPLSHDMGMVAFLTHPMQLGAELVAITPDRFLRRPALWPELITEYRGSITAAPNFAYALLARILQRSAPDSYDLSSLRVAINGAEPIDARDAHRLASAGARFGLSPGALTPAYGMAEATLGISFDVSPDTVNVDRVSRGNLYERAVALPDTGTDVREIVSVGVPVKGIEVRVVDDRSHPHPPRHVGSIEVRGASVSRGYLTEDGRLDGPGPSGWLSTGDLGYFDEHGALYVCGRAKDVIVIAGKNVYPTDIERAACAVTGVRAGNAVAVRIDSGDGREGFAVLAESAQADDTPAAERIRAEIAHQVCGAVGYHPRAVLILPPGTLPKTASGKLQRGKAAELYVRLDAEAADYAAQRVARA